MADIPRDASAYRMKPPPTPEEAAAIMAALETLREEPKKTARTPTRWELSGRLGRMLPPGRPFEGSAWNHVGWEGKS